MPPKPPINLLRGWPSASLLPYAALQTATQNVLSDHPLSAPGLLYGPDEGHLPLRKALSTWLDRFYGDAVSKWRPRQLNAVSKVDAIKVNGSEPAVAKAGGEARISITGGASQSIGVIFAAIADPLYTRRVWIVAPGYFMGFKIFEDEGFAGRLRSVPEVQEGERAGPDVQWLRREMQRVDEAWEKESPVVGEHRQSAFKPRSKYPKLYRHIIYTVPSFANPSSLTTTTSVREDLVRVARDFDALVICDDVYDMLQWPTSAPKSSNIPAMPQSSHQAEAESDKTEEVAMDKAPLPRIVDIDRYLDGGPEDGYGNVVSNGSFSKICAPGCRVGWVEGEDKLAFAISQAGTTKSGGAPSQLTSLFITDLLATGTLQSHILHTLQPAYATRYHLLMSAIRTHLLPLGVTLPQPGRDVVGGYFVWLGLPGSLRGAEVAKKALEEENLIVAKGELFEVPGEDGEVCRFPRSLRLCFAWEDEEILVEGVRRLGDVVRKMLEVSEAAEGGSVEGRVLAGDVGEDAGGAGKGIKEYC